MCFSSNLFLLLPLIGLLRSYNAAGFRFWYLTGPALDPKYLKKGQSCLPLK